MIATNRTRKTMVIVALIVCLAIILGFVASSNQAHAQSEGEEVSEALETKLDKSDADIMWLCIAAFLVFLMQAGFAFVEAGFCRAKNTTNLMMKNLMDFSIGTIGFWMLGFALMFGTSAAGIIGTDGFFLGKYSLSGGAPVTWTFAFLIFQTVFCATAATIVSGAMAERTKFKSYLLYSLVISVIIYPIFGHWAWGSLFGGAPGWLESLGFIDFAGSSVVHSVGGWVGLAGAIVLGPRIGKYDKEGKPRAIPGHSLAFAGLGVFLLWFGWFGFNPGSTGEVAGGSLAVIAVNTNLAAATAACAAMFLSWWWIGKADAGMTFNGALAGLVAITAGCANVSPLSSFIIGLLAGVLVVVACRFFERIGVDDPVGAVSVHGVCGAMGTLAVGVFAEEAYGGVNGLFFGGGLAQLGWQAIGVVTCFCWAFGLGYILFRVLKATVGLRVPREEELEGLDVVEHGAEAYPDFILNPMDGAQH